MRDAPIAVKAWCSDDPGYQECPSWRAARDNDPAGEVVSPDAPLLNPAAVEPFAEFARERRRRAV